MAGGVFGVTAHQLGRLARLLGQPDWPAYLQRAREIYLAAGTTALLADVDADLAQRATPSTLAEVPRTGTFHRRGPGWRLTWQGCQSVVSDSKGIRDLAVLLARPGQPA